jgi:alkylation response protein AidB-like acyl-CoA dehydrogenase
VALDFTLSESQQVLQKNAREFAERVLEPIVDKIDRSADAWESFLASREAYRQTAQAGFTKSFIPVFYGGAGLTALDIAIAAEELSRVDVNIPTTMLAHGLALYPVTCSRPAPLPTSRAVPTSTRPTRPAEYRRSLSVMVTSG